MEFRLQEKETMLSCGWGGHLQTKVADIRAKSEWMKWNKVLSGRKVERGKKTVVEHSSDKILHPHPPQKLKKKCCAGVRHLTSAQLPNVKWIMGAATLSWFWFWLEDRKQVWSFEIFLRSSVLGGLVPGVAELSDRSSTPNLPKLVQFSLGTLCMKIYWRDSDKHFAWNDMPLAIPGSSASFLLVAFWRGWGVCPKYFWDS